MFTYRFVNQSYRWGKPGVLKSNVELKYGIPVPGHLEIADSPVAEEKYFYFTYDPKAETHIVLYRENGDFYSEIEGESAKVFNWCYFNRSGEGFIFFKPGAKVMFHPYNRKPRMRVVNEKGIFPYIPQEKKQILL